MLPPPGDGDEQHTNSGLEFDRTGDQLDVSELKEILARAQNPDLAAAAREQFAERLAIADDLSMDTAPGSPAWAAALREARRGAAGVVRSSKRTPDLMDEVLEVFSRAGLVVRDHEPVECDAYSSTP